MFCSQCGKEVVKDALTCKECGTPVAGSANGWHIKNALLGGAILIACILITTLISASQFRAGGGEMDRSLAAKVAMLTSLFYLTEVFGVLFFVSRRAEKRTLKLG